MYFFHGRNTYYNHFCLSSMAEIHPTIIFVFLPWKKDILQPFLSFFHGRKTSYNHSLSFFHGRKTENAAVDLFPRIINLVFNRVDPKNIEK